MKNGFYLSTYFFIHNLAYLTGIKLRHDMNMSLWEYNDGNLALIKYWEMERFTGLKQHSLAFFDKEHAIFTINSLLNEVGLSVDDMQEIWGTPQLYKEHSSYMGDADHSQYAYHSLCHLFGGLLSDTNLFYNESILSIAVDGAPDNVIDNIEKKYLYSGCYSKKGNIVDIFSVCSPGIHWGYARESLQMREGSLMALGSASTSHLIDYFMKDIFVNNSIGVSDIIDEMDKLRKFVENLSDSDEGVVFNTYDSRFSIRDNKISMIMKVIHEKSIEIMEQNIDNAITRYRIKPENTYLCLRGGYALNCVANSYLMHKYRFKGFMSIPCVSDCGMSLGIALHNFYKNSDSPVKFQLKHAFYGHQISEGDLSAFFDIYNTYISCVSDFCADRAVSDIKDFPVVWFQGCAEIGPRALGHRSILADPTNPHSATVINQIKQREWWRPVAPIILEENAVEWFENVFPSPYMLNTFTIKKEKEEFVPAIIHMDKSARIQTLRESDNELLYRLIKSFDWQYRVPLLCNTSLNDKNEPIINNLDELINFALRKGFKIIYINGKRIHLKNHRLFREKSYCKRGIDVETYLSDLKKDEMLKLLNPHGISNEHLSVYIKNPKFHDSIDIRDKSQLRVLDGILKFQMNRYHVEG